MWDSTIWCVNLLKIADICTANSKIMIKFVAQISANGQETI